MLAAPRAGAVSDEEIAVVRDAFPDARGAFRIGGGHSALFDAGIVSISFEDEITLRRLGDHAEIDVVFGLDSQSAPDGVDADGDRVERGFATFDLGLALLLRAKSHGPTLVLGGTFGALSASSSSGAFSIDGYGGAVRVEIFPMYRDLVDAVVCREGPLRDWVFSGFSTWAVVRADRLSGDGGSSYAIGIGFELGRQVILPIMAAALDTSCFDPSLTGPP